MPVSASAAFVSVLLAAGCASTGAKTVTTDSTSITQTPTPGGTVHIIAYSINSDGPKSRAILTGAIGDFGPAVSVYPNGAIDPDHSSELNLALTHGSFRLIIGGLDKKIVSAYRNWPSNAATCSGSVSVTAATPIAAGSGTGSYRGITGSLDVTATIDEVDAKPVCDGTSKFLAQVLLIVGSGTVSFG